MFNLSVIKLQVDGFNSKVHFLVWIKQQFFKQFFKLAEIKHKRKKVTWILLIYDTRQLAF